MGRGGVREGGWLWRRTFCLQFPNSIQIWTANDKLRSPRLAIGSREPTTNIVKDNRERPFSRQHCALYSGAAYPRPPWSVGELRGTYRRQPVWWAATGPFSSLCPTVQPPVSTICAVRKIALFLIFQVLVSSCSIQYSFSIKWMLLNEMIINVNFYPRELIEFQVHFIPLSVDAIFEVQYREIKSKTRGRKLVTFSGRIPV